MFESSASATTISSVFAAPAPACEPLGVTSTDRDLGQALIDRRPDALPAAWRRYHPMVHRMLRRALGAGSDIEDLVQDVFLSLFRRAHALREAEAVRPFVIGITRHTLYRERRRRIRRQRLALEPDLRTPGVGSGAEGSYAIIKLAGLLQRLTEQERTSFVLRFGYGMTVPEVAGALRVSEPTAKRRLSRARECLGGWAANDPFLLSYVRGKDVALAADADC